MSSLEPVRSVSWATAPSEPAAAVSWGAPELNGRTQARPHPADPPDPAEALEQAYTRGFAEGAAEGTRQTMAELVPIKAMLSGLAQSLEQEQVIARRTAEQNVTALAIAVARWLYQKKVASDPELMKELIGRAVQLLPSASSVEVRASPADLEALGSSLDFMEADGRPLPLHWVADPSLERGSFTLAGPARLVDGRADLALRSLYERLAGE